LTAVLLLTLAYMAFKLTPLLVEYLTKRLGKKDYGDPTKHYFFREVERLKHTVLPNLLLGSIEKKILAIITILVRLETLKYSTLENLKSLPKNLDADTLAEEIEKSLSDTKTTVDTNLRSIGIPEQLISKISAEVDKHYEYLIYSVEVILSSSAGIDEKIYQILNLSTSNVILTTKECIQVIKSLNGDLKYFDLTKLDLELLVEYEVPTWILTEIQKERDDGRSSCKSTDES